MLSLTSVHVSDLGPAPNTLWNLNGGSFQQDALVTYKGWQYVALFKDVAGRSGVRHLLLGRRQLPAGEWETFSFEDHDQTEDDGHNVPSLGICGSDGTMHLSFDLHDTPLYYRHSLQDLVNDPENAAWAATSFSPVLSQLPGCDLLSSDAYFENVTYPRFASLTSPVGGLLFEYRVGISGLGDDLLFIYDGRTRCWTKRGVYLRGVQNNAYINGIDVDHKGNVHVSWCYRDYVPVTIEQSRQQAGPNGPENNHDLCYAYSPPEADGSGPGLNWYSFDGRHIGKSDETPILPSTDGILAFAIPKFSGILNQEAQFVDALGNFFVLNREQVANVETWFLYSLRASSKRWLKWSLPVLPPSNTSARGKVFATASANSVAVILPLREELLIMTALATEEHITWNTVAKIAGTGAENRMEPLFDRYRLRDGILSLFLGVREGDDTRQRIKVMDFSLEQ